MLNLINYPCLVQLKELELEVNHLIVVAMDTIFHLKIRQHKPFKSAVTSKSGSMTSTTISLPTVTKDTTNERSVRRVIASEGRAEKLLRNKPIQAWHVAQLTTPGKHFTDAKNLT